MRHEWEPRSNSERVFQTHSDVDELGRSRYAVFWIGYRPDLNADGVKGHVFFSNMEAHIQQEHGNGRPVRVIDGAGRTRYPRPGPNGESVWACCESSIGGLCGHRNG